MPNGKVTDEEVRKQIEALAAAIAKRGVQLGVQIIKEIFNKYPKLKNENKLEICRAVQSQMEKPVGGQFQHHTSKSEIETSLEAWAKHYSEKNTTEAPKPKIAYGSMPDESQLRSESPQPVRKRTYMQEIINFAKEARRYNPDLDYEQCRDVINDWILQVQARYHIQDELLRPQLVLVYDQLTHGALPFKGKEVLPAILSAIEKQLSKKDRPVGIDLVPTIHHLARLGAKSDHEKKTYADHILKIVERLQKKYSLDPESTVALLKMITNDVERNKIMVTNKEHIKDYILMIDDALETCIKQQFAKAKPKEEARPKRSSGKEEERPKRGGGKEEVNLP